jgi:glycosyltransferase involved in cell wall biosynthesis
MAINSNMVKLSIITPCTRPENLPAIYRSILAMKSSEVEWIIVYDSDKIDERIKQYEDFVPIILIKQKGGHAYGSDQRNKGLELAKGKWIYYLDDDNLVHTRLLERIRLYGDDKTILIFNQFAINRKRRFKKFDFDCIRPGGIDTAQIVVPDKYKHIRWPNKRRYMEEYDYIQDLREQAGDENFKFINRIFTYRNYLRRYEV